MLSSSASIMVPLEFLSYNNNIIILGKLLALLISLAKANTDLLGDVQAKSVHDVSEEEQVNLAFAIPIVDVADVLNLSVINHLVCLCELSLVDLIVVWSELPM